MATITYNGAQPWGSSNPPYANVNVQPLKYGEKWGNTYSISLVGYAAESIVGNLETFKNSLISTFNDNNKTLSIDGTTFDNVFVESLDIPKQRFKGRLDYTINLTAYNFDSTEILDPSDTVEQSVENDQSVMTTHTASARGVNGASGLSTARTWAQSRVNGFPSVINSLGATSSNSIIIEETENIDRTKSTYSITKKYKTDIIDNTSSSTNKVWKRQSIVTTESLEAEYKQVEITVEHGGGTNSTLSNLRSSQMSIADLKLAAETASGITLNAKPTEQSLQEDENGKKLIQVAVFNDDTLFGSSDSYFDYSVSVSEDKVTGVTSVSVDGELITRGSLSSRVTEINNFLSSLTSLDSYLHGFCDTAYTDIAGSPYTLNTKSSSSSINKNEKKGTLKLSATFNDEDYIQHYSAASWTVTVNPSTPYIKAAASATENGYYTFQDFGFLTRETVLTNVSLTADEGASSYMGATGAFIVNATNNLTNTLHSAFAGTGTPYVVDEGRTEQDADNAGGTKQVHKSYEAGSELITV
tara:strand:+ start:146 stop:1729 length:1584 start_codon:yes stop_codon:yes gene_type:complete